MYRLIALFILFTLSARAIAQTDLFLPRNFQRAYDKGTRSKDGKPGPNYWQNRADYRIKVSINPKNRRLSGEETVVYYNNSPDTLKMLRFKLAHDRYRKGSLRSSDVAPADVTDEGVRIEMLSLNGKNIEEQRRRKYNTFLDVRLGADVILPGATATATVKWSYTLPADKDASRECVCDPTTFFVPYWYPQIAVYDDYHGWADAPYTGLQEFYHDFADYDVTITFPKGYMVWATGEWQNPEELLTPSILEKWKQAHTDTAIVSIWKEADLKKGGVFQKKKQHVFHYKAKDVPDFTFAASDHYNWDATSVEVDAKTGRRTFVSAAYDSDSKDFLRVARIAADGIRLMSTWLPGYPFPYPCMTVFNGNDGMEFPMMVNDASVSENAVTSLTVHEVAHTYFPFMMGINEQDYAWMDEGWANFFDHFLADSLQGKKSTIRGYSNVAGTDMETPPMVRSRFLSGPAYGIASYSRPQSAYVVLLDMLGYELFHQCMVEYMDRWKGKHPMPYDFFNTWNEVSGQNLNWYWKPWFFDWGYPDLGIRGVEKDPAANRDLILIDRLGNLPTPIYLDLTYEDGSTERLHRGADAWREGKTQLTIPAQVGKSLKNLTLGAPTVPDTDRKNNVWSK